MRLSKSLFALTLLSAAFDNKEMNSLGYEESPRPKVKPIPKGCKEYSFYGHTVIALNEKSAIKKCKKLAGV